MSNSLSVNVQDWMTDLNLRMCTHHERGVWIDVLCLMQKSSQVGVLHWPLSQIAQATGSDMDTLSSLVRKGVLKGKVADGTCPIHEREDLPLTFAATHARKKGEENILVGLSSGDIWYCDWMVIGGHKRKKASVAAKSIIGEDLHRDAISKYVSLKGLDDQRSDEQGFTLDGNAGGGLETKVKLKQGPECPYEDLVACFRERFPNAPKPRALNSTSRLGRSIAAMWRTQSKGKNEEFSGYDTTELGLKKWGLLFDLARKSKFLRGEAPPKENGEAFRISIDWFMTPKQVERVLNGFYDRPGNSRSIASGIQESAARVAEMVARRNSTNQTTASCPTQGSIF